jgi:hypothetical protein
MPYFTSRFFMDLFIQVFIFDRRNLKAVLQDHQALGAHTGIIDISTNKLTKYSWVHFGNRPFGEVFTRQCPKCSRIKFQPPEFQGHDTVFYRCLDKGCDGFYKFEKPAKAYWVYGKPPVKGDSRGTWMGEEEDIV